MSDRLSQNIGSCGQSCMTLFMLFAAAGSLIYAAAAFAAITFGAVTVAVAATRDSGQSRGAVVSHWSPGANAATESAEARAAGEQLFQELGCIGCHHPDGAGIGPSLIGLFGRPVTDPACGVLAADLEYVRESILNPSATVASGFAPVMPSFAGKVTEDQLRALIAYVKSPSAPSHTARHSKGELQ